MKPLRVWNEVHWHDLREGDQVIALRDSEVHKAMLEETFHSAEITESGMLAVNFENKHSSGTHYDKPIDTKIRFFVRKSL